jgi:hypothetical protein
MLKAIRQFFKKNIIIEASPDYQNWRDGIYSVVSEQVGISSDQPDRVYGVIMDVGLVDDDGTPVDTNRVITMTAFASGESSLQTSFGGGIIGLGGAEEISAQAEQIVGLAQPLVPITKPAPNRDLPVSGGIYFYFLTTSGVKFYSCNFEQVEAQGHPFGEIFARFSIIKRQGEELKDKYSNQDMKKVSPDINGLYIMAFTPEELEPEELKYVTHVADGMLRAKDSTFKQLMEEKMAAKTRVEVVNIQHVANIHTPQTMQTSLMGWLESRYNVTFEPTVQKNFFPHGMRDPQGRETYILFYFDMKE